LSARGRIEDCFAEGAFAILEHIDIKDEPRRHGYGARALRSLLTQYIPEMTWLYANVDDPHNGQWVERWLNKTFPAHDMSPGSHSHMRYRLDSALHGA
jgi:hypothetical protein